MKRQPPASDRKPDLSVIVVGWNSASSIGSCLDSLVKNPPHCLFEVLFLDNASTDASAEVALRFGSAVNVIELEKNHGFAGACNEGYRRSRSEYLLFLNADIEACASALENLCRFMDSHPEAAAAGGLLTGADGTPQRGFNVRAFPTVASIAFEILMVDKIFPRNPVSRKQRMLDFSYTEATEVDQPAGACLLLRRSAFESVGLFDERFHPAWFEDVDLCLRLRKAGLKIYFVPEARFGHQGGASLEHLEYRDFLSYWYRNLLRFFDKHHGRVTTILLRGLILIGMLERMLVGVFTRPKPGMGRGDALAAYWRVFREAI